MTDNPNLSLEESTSLIEYAVNLWPGQLSVLNQHAAAAWCEALRRDEVTYRDAREALPRMAARHDRFALRDLVAAVKDLRAERRQLVGFTEGDLLDAIHAVRDADDGNVWEMREINAVRNAIRAGDMDREAYLAYLAAGEPITQRPEAIEGPGR